MNDLLFRMRVAVLWAAIAIAMTASLLLFLFVPGSLEEVLAGEMEGEPLDDAMGYFLAAFGTIPVVMAVVTLLVSDRVNRYVSLIGGLAFGLFGVFGVVSHIVAGDMNGHLLVMAVAVVFAFLIAGLGLIGLRQRTSPEPVRGPEQSPSREETTV